MQSKAQVAVSSTSAVYNMAGHSKTTSFSYFTSIELFVAETNEVKLTRNTAAITIYRTYREVQNRRSDFLCFSRLEYNHLKGEREKFS